MNARIKELAEQARIKGHWSVAEGQYLINYLNEEKFAELIVRECLDIGYNHNAYVLMGQIMEHFGIEEWTHALKNLLESLILMYMG